MPGKLPIDRVRAAEQSRQLYRRSKRRFTEKQAKLRSQAAPGQDTPGPPPAVTTDGPDDAHENGGGSHPGPPGLTEETEPRDRA